MKYMAKWGPKGFLVSPSKIVPFMDFATSVEIKSDSENDTSGTAPTNTRGRELQQITFTTQYLRSVGVDPRAQFEEWNSLIGQAHPLYIGDKRFGPAKMMLIGIAMSELQLTNTGEFLSFYLDITLQEYSEGGTSKLSSTTTASQSSSQSSSQAKAAAKYQETVERKKALNTTASALDRSHKKITDRELTF